MKLHRSSDPSPTALALPTRRSIAELRRRAVADYLGQLAEGTSRMTMRICLKVVVDTLSPDGRWGRPAYRTSSPRLHTIETFPWEQIDSAEIAVIKSRLQSERFPLKPLSAASINKHVAAVKGVMRQCFLHGIITADVHYRIMSIRRIKGSRVLRGRSVSLKERKALISQCNVKTFRGARDAAIISIMYACGLRRDEVSRLDIGDYDPGSGKLTVIGKGNKERIVDVVHGAEKAMAHWLMMRGSSHGPMFLAMTPGQHSTLRKDGRRVSGLAIHSMLAGLAEKAELTSMSPHDFRRTAIGDLLDAGVDLVTVQKMMGHESPTTTGKYDRRPSAAQRKAAMLLNVPFPEVES